MATPDAIETRIQGLPPGLSAELVEMKPESPHPAIVAWLNGVCPGLVRPGSRIVVIDGSPADAAEITGRGYEATCCSDPAPRRAEAVIAPASRAEVAVRACRGRGVVALIEASGGNSAAIEFECCDELLDGAWRVRSYRLS